MTSAKFWTFQLPHLFLILVNTRLTQLVSTVARLYGPLSVDIIDGWPPPSSQPPVLFPHVQLGTAHTEYRRVPKPREGEAAACGGTAITFACKFESSISFLLLHAAFCTICTLRVLHAPTKPITK